MEGNARNDLLHISLFVVTCLAIIELWYVDADAA